MNPVDEQNWPALGQPLIPLDTKFTFAQRAINVGNKNKKFDSADFFLTQQKEKKKARVQTYPPQHQPPNHELPASERK